MGHCTAVHADHVPVRGHASALDDTTLRARDVVPTDVLVQVKLQLLRASEHRVAAIAHISIACKPRRTTRARVCSAWDDNNRQPDTGCQDKENADVRTSTSHGVRQREQIADKDQATTHQAARQGQPRP
jgi:hypothetical protein